MTEVLDAGEVDAALRDKGLAWRREGDTIVKETEHGDFAGALAYVNRVAELAEAQDHHPDVDIRWGSVTLRLSTHSAGGLTAKDIRLAEDVDRLGASE